MDGQRVSVAVRIRPVLKGGSAMHQAEQFEPVAASRVGDNGVQLQEHKLDEACRSSSFQFDFVFDHDSTQLELYEDAVVDLIDGALMEGNNATVLAYGQTGSGKTHSMLGDVRPNPLDESLLTPQSGIFLRVLSDLMTFRARRAEKTHVVVGLSCVEIYNDKIRDLFGGKSSDAEPPQLRAAMVEDLVILQGLVVKEVTSLQSVFAEVQRAIHRRQSRATGSNNESSRSHCLFMIDVLQRDASAERPTLDILEKAAAAASKRRGESPVNVPPSASPAVDQSRNAFRGQIIPAQDGGPAIFASRIVIADLAGSEKISKSGVTGDGLAEATAINSSLTALGNVVHSLHDGTLASYRTSNLTRLLKPSFAQPSSRVLLLAQISPTQLTYDESMSTLHFANKVKQMKMVSDPGVETDRLPFEFLTAAKTYLTLAGELTVWSATTGCKPMLRTKGLSLRQPGPYFAAQPGAPKGAKERVAEIMNRGATAVFTAARDAAVRAQEEDDRNFEKSLVALEAHRKQQHVREYTESKKRVESSVLEAMRACNAVLADHILVSQSVQREAIVAEEETASLQLLQLAAGNLADLVRRTEAQLKQLEAIPVTKKKAPTSPEEDNAQAQADERFALSMWAHCNARRFLNQRREVQDAQLALLVSRCNGVKLTHWATKYNLIQPSSSGASGPGSPSSVPNNSSLSAANVALGR